MDVDSNNIIHDLDIRKNENLVIQLNNNIETNNTETNNTETKHKKSECTICTESISDSSSETEPESENFKCSICNNHVHSICIYNYGVYHNLEDMNTVKCYVCEKGLLRPNNSFGRALQKVSNKIKQQINK